MAMPAGGGVALPEIRLPSFADAQKAALEGVSRGVAHVRDDLHQVSREPLAWAALIVCATGAVVALRHPISVAIGTGTELAHQPLAPTGSATAAPPTPTVTWSPAAAAAAGLPLPTHAPRDPFAPLIRVDLLAQAGTPANAWVGVTGGGAAAISGPVTGKAVDAAQPAVTPAPAPVEVTGSTSLVPTGSRKPVPSAADKAAATAPPKPGAVAAPGSGTPVKPTAVDTQPTRGSCQVVHVVKAGESLWRIAQVALHTDDSAKISAAWHKIYDANRGVIGANPDLLQTGVQLCMPAL